MLMLKKTGEEFSFNTDPGRGQKASNLLTGRCGPFPGDLASSIPLALLPSCAPLPSPPI